MSAKSAFIICAQALLFQSAYSQYISRAAVEASGISAFGWGSIALVYDGLAAPYGYNRLTSTWGYKAPYAYNDLIDWVGRGYGSIYPSIAAAVETTPTTSCGFIVTSSSPVPPTGISVVSDTGYDGLLALAGDVPFVGSTGMEGVLATIGSGAINHGCGNSVNAMVSETTVFAPSYAAALTPGITIAPSLAPATAYGYGSGLIFERI